MRLKVIYLNLRFKGVKPTHFQESVRNMVPAEVKNSKHVPSKNITKQN